jgi:hypothetical protein
MSSNSFDATIDLRPAPSARALKGLLWLHMAALLLVLLVVPQGYSSMLAAALMGVSWWRLRRHSALGYGPRALERMTWHPDGHWSLWGVGGWRREARLRTDSRRYAGCLILRFEDADGRRHTRILVGGELPDEQLRRLWVRLRLRGGDSTETGTPASGDPGP